MKTKWLYKQIIDLEYFFHQDLRSDSKKLHQRDRDILLEAQEFGQEQKEEASPRKLIQLWLESRLTKNFTGPEERSPGTIFCDSYRIGKNLAIIKGIIVGFLAGFSFFSYTGTTPINVFQFLLLFVISQLCLVSILLTGCFLRPLLPAVKLPTFYSLILQGMVARLMNFFHKQWLATMAVDRRESANHALGIIKARSAVYGSLFYWPLFCLAQLFGIGFNLGLLGSTLLKISTSDLAFGWQSTMQFSATAIHKGVTLAALPWSWFTAEGISYPSLEAIEGSRIILKEGIYHLTNNDLVAWWPFLIFSLLFYGLLLRLSLLALGKYMETSSLDKLPFETPACQALIRRMQTPLVTTQAKPEAMTESKASSPTINGLAHDPAPEKLSGHIVLIPDDIYPQYQQEELAVFLAERGLAIDTVYRFMASYEKNLQLKQIFSERSWPSGQGIFIVMEGWMVPLVDFITYLKELRSILPPKAIIHLALIGRPDKTLFTPVAEKDFTIWQKKIEALGDPYLTIFSLTS